MTQAGPAAARRRPAGAALLLGAMLGLALAALPAVAAVADMEEPIRDRVRFSGSSAVFPFALMVGQHVAEHDGLPAPIGEPTGTNGGAQLFCAGIGLLHPDIALGSRRLSAAEQARCQAQGVTDVLTVSVGYDALGVVAKPGMPIFALSRRDLARAIAAAVMTDKGQVVANPFRRWNQIDPSLPDLPIRVVGPAPDSGKYDTLRSLVMEPSCGLPPDAPAADRLNACGTIRTDGAYIAHTLVNVMGYGEHFVRFEGPAVGIVTAADLAALGGQLVPLAIDGVLPERRNIGSGLYPISRQLFLHIKVAHTALVDGIGTFVSEFLSEAAAGPGGYLTAAGLVPLSPADREANRQWVHDHLGQRRAGQVVR